jgi:hypothetical protein
MADQLGRFNCQMGRGRTTTGMTAAALIATIAREDMTLEGDINADEEVDNGGSEEPEATQFLNGRSCTDAV